uniref:Uncharacterized protein n=1 Tax=Anguilla anguilla TaxID=7936 RepID=A0A0E9VAK3_ANGAN
MCSTFVKPRLCFFQLFTIKFEYHNTSCNHSLSLYDC